MTSTLDVLIARRPGTEDLGLPQYQTQGAAGLDVVAANPDPLTLTPGDVLAVPTGLYLALPEGWEAQLRPRSGLALRHAVMLVNSPGTIDCDYRGEVAVILGNVGREPFVVRRGQRIAQLVVAPVTRVSWRSTTIEQLPSTSRGTGGFGHTGP